MATIVDHPGAPAALPAKGRPPALAAFALPDAVWTLIAALLACTLYALTIQTRPPHIDEFYHLLAGRSWAKDGSLAILDGRYERARLFTMLVGGSFDLLGRSDLLVARLPSLLASATSVALIFHWVRQVGGMWGAVGAALLFALAGYTFDIAHFARFYALHALLTLGAAASLFAATRPDARRSILWLTASALCLALASHLQPVTAIAALALGAWLLFDQRARIWSMPPLHLVALGGVALACSAVALSLAGPALDSYRHAERWATGSQDDPLYYIREYWVQLPLMLLLWPVALVAAWRRNASLASLCAAMVMLGLALHSFAGMKAWRYAYYIFPFLCMTYGLAIAFLMDRFGGRERNLRGVALFTGVMLLLIGGNSGYRQSARLMATALPALIQSPTAIAAPVPDDVWDKAAPDLRRVTAGRGLVVTGDDLRTIAYVGPFDLFISHSRLGELKPASDFNRDFRTGRPLIDSAAGLAQVIDCSVDGVVIVSDHQWRNPMGVRPQVADLIERRLTRLSTETGFHIYSWRHPLARRSCPHVGEQALPGKRASAVRPQPPRWRCVPSGQSCPSLGIATRMDAA